MATETDALSIFQANGSDKDKLVVAYKSITDQIQKLALSVLLKNSDLSGNPMAGSVKVRRLMSASVDSYGTARAAAAGKKVKNNGVVINLDQRKEVVEEINKFDLQQYGLPDMVSRRSANFGLKVASHLDTNFFDKAESAGTDTDVSNGADIAEQVEFLIQAIETTSNDNVDGVDRDMIALTLSPAAYGALSLFIDKLPNPANGGVVTPMFHKVRIYSNVRQTKDAIAMVVGSIAQPVVVVDFATGDIPLSADTALQLFFNYGVEAVMPDLVRYATLSEISA